MDWRMLFPNGRQEVSEQGSRSMYVISYKLINISITIQRMYLQYLPRNVFMCCAIFCFGYSYEFLFD